MKIAVIDIGGTDIKHTLYDDSLHFDVKSVKSTPANAHAGVVALMKNVEDIISGFGDFDHIAVSTAGQVNLETGNITYATDNIPGYTNTNIRSILQETFNVPVTVENDVNSAALGEAFYGAGRGFPDFLCLTFGTGIGGAIVKDGQIYYGSSFSAGEFGHMLTHVGGRACTCGQMGCYEAYASTRALTEQVEAHLGYKMNGKQIFQQLNQDCMLQTLVEDWMKEIIYGLASLIHIFNSSCIILGGGIMNEVYITNYIREHLNGYIMKSFQHVKIRKAMLGNAAGILGAIHKTQLENK